MDGRRRNDASSRVCLSTGLPVITERGRLVLPHHLARVKRDCPRIWWYFRRHSPPCWGTWVESYCALPRASPRTCWNVDQLATKTSPPSGSTIQPILKLPQVASVCLRLLSCLFFFSDYPHLVACWMRDRVCAVLFILSRLLCRFINSTTIRLRVLFFFRTVDRNWSAFTRWGQHHSPRDPCSSA